VREGLTWAVTVVTECQLEGHAWQRRIRICMSLSFIVSRRIIIISISLPEVVCFPPERGEKGREAADMT